MTLRERIEAGIVRDPRTGCWNWVKFRTRAGYGQLEVNGRPEGAYRVAYEVFVGPIPDGLSIDHLCRNPACVNPAHLEPVTIRENILRGDGAGARNARKTHCSKGHPLEPGNLVKLTSGERECLICRRAHSRRYYAKNVERERQRARERRARQRRERDSGRGR